MKPWQHILLGALLALLSVAGIYLIALPPRGTPVELLPPPTPAPILVDISGEVNQPGVYALQPDSHVQDAVAAAGGLTGEADDARLNQAKKLHDGDKLIIPAKGEAPPASAGGDTTQSDSGALAGEVESGPVNVNTAAQQELELLPGIGPSRALDIISYRQSNGLFKTVEDLMNVPGIGEVTLERLRPLITVE